MEEADAPAAKVADKKRKGKESSPEVIELVSDDDDDDEEGVKIADEEDDEGEEPAEPPQKKMKREEKGEEKEISRGKKVLEEKAKEKEDTAKSEGTSDDSEEEGGESEEEISKNTKTRRGANPAPLPNERRRNVAAPPTDIYAPDLICPDCKNPNPDFEEDYANGDVICRECGLVVAKVVDMGEEKRNFAESGINRSRTSAVDTLLNDGGLRTQISDSGGKGVAQWHSRVQNSVEDAKLLNGYSQIEHIAEILKVTESTKLISKQLFHRFESKRGKSMRLKIEPLVAAIIYIASKKTLPFKHISRETQIPIKKITESYRKLKQILPNQDSSELVSPADLVPRVCSEMRLSHKLVNLAKDIAQEGTKYLEGKNPSSIAAASVYLAATIMGESASPHGIAEAASISAATVHNVYKELQSHQHELKCLQST